MCGIAGVVRLGGSDPMAGTAARMRDRILHRGPDGSGEFDAPGVSLAACRLAIVDLDRHGIMPMASPDDRYRIVHNGEIYNRLELRAELEAQGVQLRTTTDTEVLLHLFARHGPAILDRLDGMFAFAIWDADRRELFAARDRCGEKPFFYAVHEGRLYFASEPKALFAAGVPCAFDMTTLTELLTFRATAGARTPYVGVSRLLPGQWLSAGREGLKAERWWAFPTAGPTPVAASFADLLQASVRRRLIADVRVGALLSGGLDSSSVTAVAQAESSEPLPAFTVRYDAASADEGEFATAAAIGIGVEHHEIRVPSGELPDLLADTAWHLDEPMAFNASPELLAVSRYARERVRVLLTGESADELFGGYGRFRQYRHLRLMSAAGYALRPVGGRLRAGSRLDRAAKASRMKRPEWIAGTYGDLERFDRAPLSEWAPYRFEIASRAVREHPDPVLQALAYERSTHLPAVLDNTDRLTMGAAMEARLPFTAPALLEFAGLARRADLFAGPNGKKPLRDAMAGRLPPKVLSRRKKGWTSPYRDYLRQSPELRSWLAAVPGHAIVADSKRGPANARAIIDGFLAGNDALASDAWTIGRIVLWHQVCIEGIRQPFGRSTPRRAST